MAGQNKIHRVAGGGQRVGNLGSGDTGGGLAKVRATGWQRDVFAALAGAAPLAGHQSRTPADGTAGGLVARGIHGNANIQCDAAIGEATAALASFFWVDAERFILWLGGKYAHRINQFERRVIETELESLKQFSAKKMDDADDRRQMGLL